MWSRSGREITIDRDGFVETTEGVYFIEIRQLTDSQFNRIHLLLDELRAEARRVNRLEEERCD